MHTSKQTEGRISWFALRQPARSYKSSWRTTVTFGLSPSPSGITADRGAAGELLAWWWGPSSSATSLSAQEWDSLVKALSQHKPSGLMQGVAFLDFTRRIFQIISVWRQTCHLIIWCAEQEWKERTGASLWFSRCLGGYLHEAREERHDVTLMYLFHCILLLLPYEFVVFSLSPPSSILTTGSWKVATIRSSPDISPFLSP